MSSIGVTGAAGSSLMMMGMGGHRRPDPAEMAEKLFSRIDADNQGYIEQADLESALGQVEGSDAAALFSKLDGDGDGKVTRDEFSEALKAVADELDSQFASMRMQGGMPPLPPPGDDAGFSKEALQSQLKEIGSADGQRGSLISRIVDNFDAADTDGDGKVSFREAMAYDESSGGSSSGRAAGASSESDELQLMRQIMRLAEAYGLSGEAHPSTLSASA